MVNNNYLLELQVHCQSENLRCRVWTLRKHTWCDRVRSYYPGNFLLLSVDRLAYLKKKWFPDSEEVTWFVGISLCAKMFTYMYLTVHSQLTGHDLRVGAGRDFYFLVILRV